MECERTRMNEIFSVWIPVWLSFLLTPLHKKHKAYSPIFPFSLCRFKFIVQYLKNNRTSLSKILYIYFEKP